VTGAVTVTLAWKVLWGARTGSPMWAASCSSRNLKARPLLVRRRFLSGEAKEIAACLLLLAVCRPGT
jgi:hypothetical protein